MVSLIDLLTYPNFIKGFSKVFSFKYFHNFYGISSNPGHALAILVL
jgi:hypothetical protein